MHRHGLAPPAMPEINPRATYYSWVGVSRQSVHSPHHPLKCSPTPAMTVILVFPQSSGGFWGGVTECGLGSTRSTRNVAKCCAPRHRSGTSVGGEPVSTTVVDSQSTEAARGSPAADPILEPAPAGILGAPTGESADDAAASEVEVGRDREAGPDLERPRRPRRSGRASKPAVTSWARRPGSRDSDGCPDGSKPERAQGTDAQGTEDQGPRLRSRRQGDRRSGRRLFRARLRFRAKTTKTPETSAATVNLLRQTGVLLT